MMRHPRVATSIQFRTKTGGYRWFAGSAKPVLDEDGQPAAAAGFKDVTDVVTARHRAEAREARRKAMLDTFLDPHVLLQAVRDEAGHIVDFAYADANQVAAHYMQMSPEDLRGSTVLQLLPGQAGSGMLALYAEAVETGVPLVLDDYAYQHEILQSHRRYDVRGVKVGDALSFTWRDVTERFTATRLIAESEERFRLLAENSSNVVLRSRDGRILWVSPSLTDMLGWSPQEWIDTNLGIYPHPGSAAADEGSDRRGRRRGRAQPIPSPGEGRSLPLGGCLVEGLHRSGGRGGRRRVIVLARRRGGGRRGRAPATRPLRHPHRAAQPD